MHLQILITGTNRGIGLEFVRQYVAQGAHVFAAARKPFSTELAMLAKEHIDQLSLIPLDVSSEQELRAATAMVRGQTSHLDILINNAGIKPGENGLGKFTQTTMLEVMHTNAVAPVLVGQAFLELLRHGTHSKLVNISSQLGSFATNQSGIYPIYSASKAALNMFTRSFAHAATGVITIAVHPGWVQTQLGGTQAPLSPTVSVKNMRALIEHLTPADNGQFFNYDGRPHSW